MSLLVLIFLAIIFYTLFDVFAALAGGKIDANVSAVLFNGLGAIIPLIVYVYYKYGQGLEIVKSSTIGIVHSILAGVSIAIFSILLIKIFEKGGLAYVVPLIYGGSIILASVIGWVFLKEYFSWIGLFGVSVIGVGIALVIFSKMHAA